MRLAVVLLLWCGLAIAQEAPCPSDRQADAAHIGAIRKCQIEAFLKSTYYQNLNERYPTTMSAARMGGVYVEVFTPKGGISKRNESRVLINVHGGGFLGGSRISSHIESVPVASLGNIKVVSIDYRMGPEYVFPAASEDVAAVYRELLQTYHARNIGIYGCSAGGLLTAQAVAWFNKHGLPRPGAIGMLCEGGFYWSVGDSGRLDTVVTGQPLETAHDTAYLKDVSLTDPLVFPAQSPELLAQFPPTLLLSSTRDKSLSSVVMTHSRLVNAGVEAELHVWEGLGHAFMYDPDHPESKEAWTAVVKFFDKFLDAR